MFADEHYPNAGTCANKLGQPLLQQIRVKNNKQAYHQMRLCNDAVQGLGVWYPWSVSSLSVRKMVCGGVRMKPSR